MKVLPYGASALLVEVEDAAQVLPLAAAVAGLRGVEQVVPGARTVLAVTTPDGLAPLRAELDSLEVPATTSTAASNEVKLAVTYDGADLAATAAELGLDADGLVRAHVDGDYVVAFCGFAPGFAYLAGLDPALHVARLPEPRTRVPAGSVAMAGEFTGVYPRESPGGWRLLGTTSAPLWAVDRDPPALLAPGTRVRFRPA